MDVPLPFVRVDAACLTWCLPFRGDGDMGCAVPALHCQTCFCHLTSATRHPSDLQLGLPLRERELRIFTWGFANCTIIKCPSQPKTGDALILQVLICCRSDAP